MRLSHVPIHKIQDLFFLDFDKLTQSKLVGDHYDRISSTTVYNNNNDQPGSKGDSSNAEPPPG